MKYLTSPESVNLVAVYDGSKHIAEAGHVLEGPPEVTAAIVHNVGATGIRPLVDDESLRGVSARNALFKAIPELLELDGIVKQWSESNLPDTLSLEGLACYGTKNAGIAPHYDEPSGDNTYDGPLTLSLRHDQTAFQRVFSVTNPNRICLDANGQVSAPTDFLYDEAERLAENMATLRPTYSGMIAIQQEPGDLIIMQNYPTPTIHAVCDESDMDESTVNTDTGLGVTQTYLATWLIKHTPAVDPEEW